jgi:hypothetical protein
MRRSKQPRPQPKNLDTSKDLKQVRGAGSGGVGDPCTPEDEYNTQFPSP